MKTSTFIRRVGYCGLLSLVTFKLSAQNNPFDVKKHKDTLLNKSGLNAITVNGKIYQKSLAASQVYGNLKKSISTAFPLSNTPNLRQENSAEVVFDKETGLPIFISTPNNTTNTRLESNDDIKTACFDYLKAISSITKIEKPSQDFAIKDIHKDDIGKTHIKLIQKYKGIKIYASEVAVHFNQSNLAESFNGNYHFITKNLDTIPSISPDKAIANVIADVSTKTFYKELSPTEKDLLEYDSPFLDTVVYEDRSLVRSHILAYHVSIRPNFMENWEYFVDAKTGNIIHSYKNSCHVDGPRTATAKDLNGTNRTINSYQIETNYYLLDASRPMYNSTTGKGIIITMDANSTFDNNFQVQPIISTSNTWASQTAVSAHYNAGIAYDYYKNIHGRNSIDGNGGTIYSFINVTDPKTGEAFDNAFWTGKYMFYGNGNTYFKPLAGGLDVAGHEMTHGVVQNSANLKYEGESGAINESMADIFGCMMDSTDWLIGEDVVKLSAYPSGALRSLSDPHNGDGNSYQPRIYSEKYTGSLDNGGVHYNSGIPNWAFYKYATALGSRNKASKVFYRALVVYLTRSSQFIDLRLAVIQSAKDLYGNSSNEATQAGLAFDAVGIINGAGGVYTTTLPTNPGTEYMLSYDTDGTNTNGLYRSSPQGANFVTLLNKSVYNKPSVTDDGETTVFVGNDNKLYTINTNPSKPLNLTKIDDNAIWSNIAISKDGSKVAAITLNQDASIYIITGTGIRNFPLYNPTHIQGLKSGGPVYADAIEWSHDGQSLVYDCFNKIDNSNGNDITYWDINLIHVWDNSTNDFADGQISKLFDNLEEGESIGNPTFSKNSPHIIAFDYANPSTNTYGVVGLDLEKNDIAAIVTNNTIGWPSFNKTDSRIAFTTKDGSGNFDINYVTLNSDKISSNGVQTKLIDNSKWPVYYTVGTRSLITGIEDAHTTIEESSINVFPNPTTGEISIILSPQYLGSSLEVYNQLGVSVLSQKVSDSISKFDLTNLTTGIYTISVKGNGNMKHYKVIKQ